MEDVGHGAAAAFEAKARATTTEERSLAKLAIAKSKKLGAVDSEGKMHYRGRDARC